MSQIYAGVDVHASFARMPFPQCGRETHRGAHISAGWMGEPLLLTWQSQITDRGVQIGVGAVGTPPEPATPDEHQPVIVTGFRLRPPNVVSTAGHRTHGELGPRGEGLG